MILDNLRNRGTSNIGEGTSDIGETLIKEVLQYWRYYYISEMRDTTTYRSISDIRFLE
jgi:hypothetical protein